MNLQTVVSRNVSALDSLVLTIGNIHSGSEWNVIPGEAQMGGTIRFFDPRTRGPLCRIHTPRCRTYSISLWCYG